MADIIWEDISEANRQKIQGYAVGMTTEGNPALPATGSAANRKALLTEKKIITLAINELLTAIDGAKTTVNAFNDRFSLVVGNEADPAGLQDFNDLQGIAENITKAVLGISTTVEGVVTKVDALEQTVATVESTIATIESTVASIEGSITNVQTELTTMNTTITNIQNDIATIEPGAITIDEL
jgi:uncharacterized coiled-coil protein SlyX